MADYYLDSVTGSDADNGTTRALAEATLAAALADMSAGDRLFVDAAHTENPGATTTYTVAGTAASPCLIACVSFAGTADPNPPVSADLTTGGDVTLTGANFVLTVNGGYLKLVGMTFLHGGTGSSSAIALGTADSAQYLELENCTMGFSGTVANVPFNIGNTGTTIHDLVVILRNSTLTFGAATQRIGLRGGRVLLENCTLGGTALTTLFIPAADTAAFVLVRACNFNTTAPTNLVNVAVASPVDFHFVACRLSSGVVVTTGAFTGPGGVRVFLWDCDSGDTHYRSEQHEYGGTAVTVLDVVRSGGFTAQPEAVAIARKVTTSANVARHTPWRADGPMRCVGWFSSTGSKTLTVYILHGQSAALTNADIWLEVQYLGTAGFPQAVIATDAPADVLAAAANQTSTTSIDWDDGATARANSTAYNLGDIRRAATPNGKLFIVTTAGTSAGSEPAGFGTSNDGDAITDNTVTWRQMWRQSLDVTMTVNEVGAVEGRVCVGKPSIDVWFCPKMAGVEQQPVEFTVPGGAALSLVAAAGVSILNRRDNSLMVR